MSRIRSVLLAFQVPKDILVYDTEEVSRWRYFFNHVVERYDQNPYRPQHFLYFFPLPQGHGAFRPTFLTTSRTS